MDYIVYLTTNLVNGKIYVGAHKTLDVNDSYLGSGTAIQRAIKKYGAHSFKRDVMFVFDNSDDMYEMEARIVDTNFVKRQDNYNGIPGGMGGTGRTASDETRAKMSASHTGRIVSDETRRKISERERTPFSDEAKAKMSAAKKGDAHPNYGKKTRPMSDEAKQRIRDTRAAQPILTCPHCSKQSRSRPNMIVHHFDACKYKESINISEV